MANVNSNIETLGASASLSRELANGLAKALASLANEVRRLERSFHDQHSANEARYSRHKLGGACRMVADLYGWPDHMAFLAAAESSVHMRSESLTAVGIYNRLCRMIPEPGSVMRALLTEDEECAKKVNSAEPNFTETTANITNFTETTANITNFTGNDLICGPSVGGQDKRLADVIIEMIVRHTTFEFGGTTKRREESLNTNIVSFSSLLSAAGYGKPGDLGEWLTKIHGEMETRLDVSEERRTTAWDDYLSIADMVDEVTKYLSRARAATNPPKTSPTVLPTVAPTYPWIITNSADQSPVSVARWIGDKGWGQTEPENGVSSIARRRAEQIAKGFDIEHDKAEHAPINLASAAVVLLHGDPHTPVPWEERKSDENPITRADLERAGAYVAAAIDLWDATNVEEMGR